MTPEIIIGVIAVFIAGGAMGAAGALLGTWLLRKIQEERGGSRPLKEQDLARLRSDVSDISRRLHQIDGRLDFTEQLLGGALPISRPSLEPPAEEPTDPEDLSIEGDPERSDV